MKLSRRLLTIAQFVPQGGIPCDIGSDHGLVMRYLTDQNIVSKGYASDNKQGPYLRLIKEFADEPRIFVYLADGLNDLPDDADTIIIAGMGGSLLANIIEKGSKELSRIKQAILAPHSEPDVVRKKLMDLGWRVEEETIVEEDGQFYDIMRFVPARTKYEPHELVWGPLNLVRRDQPLLNKMLARRLEIGRILKNNIPPTLKASLMEEQEWLIAYDQNK